MRKRLKFRGLETSYMFPSCIRVKGARRGIGLLCPFPQ